MVPKTSEGIGNSQIEIKTLIWNQAILRALTLPLECSKGIVLSDRPQPGLNHFQNWEIKKSCAIRPRKKSKVALNPNAVMREDN